MPTKVNNIIAQAAQAKRKNWIKSLTILQNGLSEFSSDPQLLEALGDLHLFKNKNQKALQYYRQADKAAPHKESVLHKMANLHMLDFNFVAAKNCLEQIANPSSASIFKKAVCCIHLQVPDEATSLLESILDDPTNPEAVSFLLCEQYISLKKFAKAKEFIEILQKKYPHSNKVTFLLGYYLYCQKNGWRHTTTFCKRKKTASTIWATSKFWRKPPTESVCFRQRSTILEKLCDFRRSTPPFLNI